MNSSAKQRNRETRMNPALGSTRIGIIGGGAMGGALAGGVIASGVAAARVQIAEPQARRREELERELGVQVHERGETLLPHSDVVVLAVKPGQVMALLTSLRENGAEADLQRPLWISIAAGVRVEALEAGLPRSARVVRAMPNTPAQVQAGVTALSAGAACGEADRETARALFECVGVVWEAPREALFDAVTALSGCGPAYVFALLEALEEAAVREGLPADVARRLAVETTLGAAELARQSPDTPGELRERVSSPGGATLAALAELQKAGFHEALCAAVKAAAARSRELGQTQ